jgi:transcriptional regulator with XRE-family HTH domain
MVTTKRKDHSAAEDLNQTTARRIVQLRKQRGWTQEDLSEKAGGLDQGFISRLESGQREPCLSTLAVLAKAFGISISELLKGIG